MPYDLPDINQVIEDNPHGRGWHLIETKPIGPNSVDYDLFGARKMARYQSDTGTCGIPEGKDLETGEVYWKATHCSHNYQHRYMADYFLNNGVWELGAN